MRHHRWMASLVVMGMLVAACDVTAGDPTTTSAGTATTSGSTPGTEGPPWVRQCDAAEEACANILPGGSSPTEPEPHEPDDSLEHYCEYMPGQAIIQSPTEDPAAFGFAPVEPIDLFFGEPEAEGDFDELQEAEDVLALLAENDAGIYKLAESEADLFEAIEQVRDSGAAASPHYILRPAGYWRWGPYSTVQRIDPSWTWDDLAPTAGTDPIQNDRVVVIDTGGNGDPSADIGVNMDPWEEEPPPSNQFDSRGVGHGTFVASIVKQYNPELTVDLYRGSWKNGTPNEGALLAAVLRAQPAGAVVNLSGGTYPCREDYTPLGIGLAITMAGRVVAASGNDGDNHVPPQLYPASDPAVDGVSAYAYDFGSDAWAPAPWANPGEVYTPGEDVVGWFHDKTEGSLAVWSGTSFATPHHAARVASGN